MAKCHVDNLTTPVTNEILIRSVLFKAQFNIFKPPLYIVNMSAYTVFIFLTCVLFSCHLVSVSAAAATFFRRDYEFFHSEKAFYKVHSVAKTWNDARKQCILEGATLAVPNTAAEVEVFKQLMEKKNGPKSIAYMGIQAVSKGIFTTLDGILIDDIYHGWAPGEPNDADNNEDCVLMRIDGTLNDVDCASKITFICEKSQDSVKWNNACATADLAYDRIDGLDHCYKIHLEPKNWTDAYATCIAEQSYLAILNSREESKALIQLFNTKPHKQVTGDFLSGAIHLGFHDRFSEGVFTTIQGQSLRDAGYDKWGGGQPDQPRVETCGTMFYDGELNDIRCERRCFFICERDVDDGGSALSLRIAGEQ